MAKPPKWITRDARKVRMAGPEGEVARHRAQQEHLAAIEAAADVSSAKRAGMKRWVIGMDVARGPDHQAFLYSDGTSILDPKAAKERLEEVEEQIAAVVERLIPRELARLADGQPQLWTCSIRDELLKRHLIETTQREDGRWAGDRITMKGERLLRASVQSRS